MEETIMYREILEQPDLIKDISSKNGNAIKEIATIIKEFNPNNIMIAARGTSMHAGIFAKYLFQIYYNKITSIAYPAVFTVYDAEPDLSKTLVLAISQSGSGKDICKVIEKSNNSGALTIAITNTPGSIIEKEAKYNLYNEVKKAEAYAATKTYTSTLYLIIRLLYELTGNEELNLDDNKVSNALVDGINKVNEIKEIAKYYKNVNNSIALSRGYSLSLADELALKLKEAAHYPVMGFPTSEFYHGPIVIANENTPAIIFGIDRKTNHNIVEMINDLKKSHVNILSITNNKEVSDISDRSIFINEENDMYALFTSVVILQLLTCEISILRGFTPDYAVVLEKIETI